MKSRIKIVVIFLLFSSISMAVNPWGFYAHKKANRYAVFTLPEELIVSRDLNEFLLLNFMGYT